MGSLSPPPPPGARSEPARSAPARPTGPGPRPPAKPTAVCASHPDHAAVYVCDGCAKHLCQDCIKTGHRLLFCKLCGERALPLEPDQAASAPELQLQKKRQRAYGFRDALVYPFRGLGIYAFFAFIVCQLLAYAFSGFIALLMALLIPGFVFAIVRSTAKGETELPDWPEWDDFGERIKEWLMTAVMTIVAMLPIGFALYLGQCGLAALLDLASLGSCILAVGLAAPFAAMIWTLSLGSTAVFESYAVTLRTDLHLRAFFASGTGALKTSLFVAIGYVTSLALQTTLAATVPVLGQIAATVVSVYTLLTGAHLVGLLFRHHHVAMKRIYQPHR